MTDLLPVLSVGAHPSPIHGACLTEYVSHLAGEPWSDSPATCHPALRRLATGVNDHTSDTRRSELLRLAPRLLGTSGTPERVDVLLAGWLAVQAPPGPGRVRLLRRVTAWTPHDADPHGEGMAARVLSVEAADLHFAWLRSEWTTDAERADLLAAACGRLETLTGRVPQRLGWQQIEQCRRLVGVAA